MLSPTGKLGLANCGVNFVQFLRQYSVYTTCTVPRINCDNLPLSPCSACRCLPLCLGAGALDQHRCTLHKLLAVKAGVWGPSQEDVSHREHSGPRYGIFYIHV